MEITQRSREASGDILEDSGMLRVDPQPPTAPRKRSRLAAFVVVQPQLAILGMLWLVVALSGACLVALSPSGPRAISRSHVWGDRHLMSRSTGAT
jgi:hypothetical protein